MRKGEQKVAKSVWRESEQPVAFIKTKNLCPLRHGVGLYVVAKRGYATT